MRKKQALVKALTNAFVEICGATPQSVQVVISEVEKEHWSVAGVLMSDKA